MGKKRVMVIAAHPDDEILGCGGTLLKHEDAGDELAWVIVTSPLKREGFSDQRIKSREQEIKIVGKAIGFKKVYKMGYPTIKLSSSSLITLVPELGTIFNEFKPEVVYVMNRSDAHSDHRVVFEAVAACTKSFRYPFLKSVLMYECISETEFAPALDENAFVPNYFVDISKYLKKKQELLKVYASEIGEHPFPRSLRNVKALATFRGAFAGVEYAEAFQLIRHIEKEGK